MSSARSNIKFKFFPAGTFQSINDDDPLPYYYKPIIGSLYRYRIQQGLSALSPPYQTVLEFGYGSGLLLPTLSEISDKLYGIDTESDPEKVGLCLSKINVFPILIKNDLLKIASKENTFDLIVAFSVFEHIRDCKPIIAEMFRILKPGGTLLVGMPRVDRKMAKLFKLIGYNTIERIHVTDYRIFLNTCEGYFKLEKFSKLFPFLPLYFGLYFNMLLRKNEI